VQKSQLAEQLSSIEADPSRGSSNTVKNKLKDIEKSLQRARSETRKHQQMYKLAEREAQKCKAMERKISELKSGKVTLMKRQKETVSKHRVYTEKKTREIQSLKRKERKQVSERSER